MLQMQLTNVNNISPRYAHYARRLKKLPNKDLWLKVSECIQKKVCGRVSKKFQTISRSADYHHQRSHDFYDCIIAFSFYFNCDGDGEAAAFNRVLN